MPPHCPTPTTAGWWRSGCARTRASTARCSPARRTPPTRRKRSSATPGRPDRRRLSADGRASTRSGATASTTRSSPPPGGRPAGAAAQRHHHPPPFPTSSTSSRTTSRGRSSRTAFAMMANLVSLMHTGVPARYPKLKVAFTEAGVAWVPYMMWRMDKYYQRVPPRWCRSWRSGRASTCASRCGSPPSRSRSRTNPHDLVDDDPHLRRRGPHCSSPPTGRITISTTRAPS